ADEASRTITNKQQTLTVNHFLFVICHLSFAIVLNFRFLNSQPSQSLGERHSSVTGSARQMPNEKCQMTNGKSVSYCPIRSSGASFACCCACSEISASPTCDLP